MAKYIMALDSGTTSNRCILFDRSGSVCSIAQKEFTQHFPRPGWVEHDAEEIFSTQLEVAKQAMQNIGAAASDIAAIGITNQRETVVVWNRHTGRPICNAIVWQCRRTAPYCDELREKGLTNSIRSKTGLVIDPYFSATKLRWILENVPDARPQAEQGDLLFGTIETWLIWKLSGGRIHVTDYSNASRTMLFNIHTLDWDEDILKELDIRGNVAGLSHGVTAHSRTDGTHRYIFVENYNQEEVPDVRLPGVMTDLLTGEKTDICHLNGYGFGIYKD